MAIQQKGVQQDTAYSAVVVNDHIYVSPSLPISFVHVSMTHFWVKNDIGTGTYDHSLQLHLSCCTPFC